MLTVCIITHNRVEQLEKTLVQLDTINHHNLHIYILNNGSTDGTTKLLNDKYKHREKYTIFDSPINLGVAKGRAHLWEQVTSKYILSMDDDILIDNDAVSQMMLLLESKAGIALVSPNIVDSVSGRLINAPRRGLFVLPTFYEACFAIRNSAIAQVGHFDANLQVAGEGLDYSIRLRKAGFLIFRDQNTSVIHVDRLRENRESMDRRQQWLQSFAYVYWKNFGPVRALLLTLKILASHVKTGLATFGLSYAITLPRFAVAGAYKGFFQSHKIHNTK